MTGALTRLQSTSSAVRQGRVEPVGAYAEAERVGIDGLPHPGAVLYPGQAYCSVMNPRTGTCVAPAFISTAGIR